MGMGSEASCYPHPQPLSLEYQGEGSSEDGADMLSQRPGCLRRGWRVRRMTVSYARPVDPTEQDSSCSHVLWLAP
jgi:hypothetical protein